MKNFKTKASFGKKLLAAVSAATIAVSSAGSLLGSNLTAFADDGIYYASGTFNIDDNGVISKVTEKQNDYGKSLANVLNEETVKVRDTDVGLNDGLYIYVARGTEDGGKVTWDVNAWSSTNSQVNLPHSIDSVPTISSVAEYNAYKDIGAPVWKTVSWLGGETPDSTNHEKQWLTLQTNPYNNDGAGYESGYEPGVYAYIDSTWKGIGTVLSVNQYWDYAQGKFVTISGDRWVYNSIDTASESSNTFFRELSRKNSPLFANSRDPKYDGYTDAANFETLITTKKLSTSSDKTVTTVPTFATPDMIQRTWLNMIPVIATNDKVDGKNVTGIKLNSLKIDVSYDPESAPDGVFKLGKNFENGADKHVAEFENLSTGSVSGLKKFNDRTAFTESACTPVSVAVGGNKNFGTNTEPLSLTSNNVNYVYSEDSGLADLFNTSAMSQMCTTAIAIKNTDDGYSRVELSNARLMTTLDVSATYSYTADAPRVNLTVTQTISTPSTSTPSNKSIATDSVNTTHTMSYSVNAAIHHVVPYDNLTTGDTYTLRSTVYDLATSKQVMAPVTMSFEADSTETVATDIPVNSTVYSGKTFAVTAEILDGDSVVTSYMDITDKETQVVFPTVATVLTASNRTSKTVGASKSTTLTDLVRFTGLTPGQKYTVTGHVLLKDADNTVIEGEEGSNVVNDLPILATKVIEFTPTTADGSVAVDFVFNTSELTGKRVVAVESIADGPTNVVVGEHIDVEDANQIVTIKTSNDVYTGGNDMTNTFTLIAAICAVLAVGSGAVIIAVKRRDNKQ